MQNPAGNVALLIDRRQIDGCRSIISDIMSLIERVEGSAALVEAALEASGGEDNAGNMVVLDDLTPRYALADAALKTCNATLREALDVLMDKPAKPFRHPATAIRRSSAPIA
jgi:hypothetical protein